MARLRYNGLSNSLGASLTSGGTAITFASKLTYAGGDVPTISGSDYIPLSILDADGNCAEVVHLTAYTSAATTGTIARGKEDTSGVAHDSGAVVVNGPTVADVDAVSAEVARITSNQTISSNTLTAIQWNSEVEDTAGMVDLGANNTRITVPTDGLYLATGTVVLNGLDSSAEWQIRFHVNGSVKYYAYRSVEFGEYFYAPISGQMRLSAGDYVEVVMFHNIGSFDVQSGADRTFLRLTRIGM